MGCVKSKPRRCRHCWRPYSPISRTYSMHVHHTPEARGESYHVVALTSSALSSVELRFDGHRDRNGSGQSQRNDSYKRIRDFGKRLAEAKTWSSLITQKLTTSSARTRQGEPDTIDTWELMEGLEDVSPLPTTRFRSLSFDLGTPTVMDPRPTPKRNVVESSPKPLRLQLHEERNVDEDDNMNSNSNSNSNSDFNPEVISSFRKRLQKLSPDHPFHLRAADVKQIRNRRADQEERKGREKLILYFTTLRGIRKTYEDCCHVRAILKAVGVRVDERDVSMHSRFKEELRELLMEDGNRNGGMSLPRVFIGRRQIGGAEQIRRLHEDGHLEKLLDCCEKLENGADGGVCVACGDIRFLPCETCSGSCKVFYEHEHEDDEEVEYGFHRCVDCNENGLVRCSICCH